MSYPGIIPV